MEFKKYRIASLSDGADKIRVFKLEPVDGVNISFKPGQFIKLYDSERKTFRPYSIASLPSDNQLELAIKLECGIFTTYLATLHEGDFLWVEGPLGHFHYDGEEKACFIAGGVGIAPIVGMLRDVAHQRFCGNYVLFYSTKHAEDFTYQDELARIAKEKPCVKVVFTVTQPPSSDWKGETGRIDAAMIQKHVPDPEKHKWYICGPLKMTIAMKDILLGLGVPKDKIQFEGWG
jgi:ferredoxin-NADP reductase